MERLVTSAANAELKKIRSLKDKDARREYGLMIAEGGRTVTDLPDTCVVRTLVLAESARDEFIRLADRRGVKDVLVVPDKLFRSLCDTVTPSGVLAVVATPPPARITANDCMVLDGISDPGNFGTIARTCAACGVEQILAVNCTDWTSPKVVRASMGCVFRVSVTELNDPDAAVSALSGHEVCVLDMKGEDIFRVNPGKERPTALVVGSEAHGVSPFFRARADKTLSLPMRGGVESLNAAIAASVALYTLVCGR